MKNLVLFFFVAVAGLLVAIPSFGESKAPDDDDDTPEELFCEDWQSYNHGDVPASPWTTTTLSWGAGDASIEVFENPTNGSKTVAIDVEGYYETRLNWDHGAPITDELLVFEFDVQLGADYGYRLLARFEDENGDPQIILYFDPGAIIDLMAQQVFCWWADVFEDPILFTMRVEIDNAKERYSVYINDAPSGCMDQLWWNYLYAQDDLHAISFASGLKEIWDDSATGAGGHMDNFCAQTEPYEFIDPCGGDCGTKTYNACTCDADDPCLWINDGVCDYDACMQAVGDAPNDQAADCPSCDGYQGRSFCCREPDPCGLAGNVECNCFGLCEWDDLECTLPEIPQIVLMEEFQIEVPPVLWGLEPTSSNTWDKGSALLIDFANVDGADDFQPGGNCGRMVGNDVSEEQDELLITPPIDLSSLTSPTLSFWNAGYAAAKADQGTTVTLEVSTDAQKGTWTPIWTYPDADWTEEFTWYEKTVDLSTYEGQTIWLGWRYTWNGEGGDNGLPYALDTVVVTAVDSGDDDDDDAADDDDDDDDDSTDDDDNDDNDDGGCCG